MNQTVRQAVLAATGATDLYKIEKLQELWSGYGAIVRYGLNGSSTPSVIVKHVRLPTSGSHPRGWNTDISHRRKVTSYEVELAWYNAWSSRCDQHCYVPRSLSLRAKDEQTWMVLEDLSATGFDTVKVSVNLKELKTCITWLSEFHATFLGEKPQELWTTGTYWHLATRPDELHALEDDALKHAARQIDQMLSQSPYQTFVHGDAKLANFCFSNDGRRVAAVDFQYVGGGCGMKDLAYFIGSCLNEKECERLEEELLEHYFSSLAQALKRKDKLIAFTELENDWRTLFPVAWTDFHRFIKGWSPGHWKINGYSERIARQVIASL